MVETGSAAGPTGDAAVATFDVKRERKDLYAPPEGAFVAVEIPPMTFLAIDGHGDPNRAPAYRNAVEALYASSYALKFASKARFGRDYVVAPLEGLWYADDPTVFASRAKADWSWTMMIRQPGWLSEEALMEGIAVARRKKPLAALDAVRVFPFAEGMCLQILHRGSYDDEAPVLARLHDEIMPTRNLTWNGPHHEIYLSDPRRTEAAKLKTILRQPVRLRDDVPEKNRDGSDRHRDGTVVANGAGDPMAERLCGRLRAGDACFADAGFARRDDADAVRRFS